MKRIALIILLATTTSASAQYGGPPMWDRDYRDWGQEEQRRFVPPLREPYGPQFGPCIYQGRCGGPDHYRQYDGPYRMPPYPGDRRMEEDY